MKPDSPAQDSLRITSRRDWKTSFLVGGVLSVLMSASFFYGESHPLATGAIHALSLYLFWAGIVGIMAGAILGIIASGNPHGGAMGVVLVGAFFVNLPLYAVVTYSVLRALRAAARHIQT